MIAAWGWYKNSFDRYFHDLFFSFSFWALTFWRGGGGGGWLGIIPITDTYNIQKQLCCAVAR